MASASQPTNDQNKNSSSGAAIPSVGSSTSMFKPSGQNIDLAWKWNSLKDKNNRKSVTCDFCLKVSTGGITRAKKHQIGIKGDVGSCKKISEDIRLELKAAYKQKKSENNIYLEGVQEDEEGEDEVQEVARLKSAKRPITSSMEVTSAAAKKRNTNAKGPTDLHFFQKPEETIQLGKTKRQTSINDACQKEARARTIQYIARFFFRNGISFNVAQSKSFKLMIEAVGNYGPHLKPPSYHELRVPLLKKELEYTEDLLKGHEEERMKYGCSIMSDGWTDRKNRTLINFLVNCSLGTMFVKSVDASEYMKTGDKVYELLNSFVEEIGKKNVIQLVTDNGSNYVMAGKLLQATRTKLFWTPCAAHCLDLMLEDIGKIAKVKRVIQRGIKLVDYIYNHSLALNTMRKFTNKSELVRHGVTRFATTFLTLQRLHKQKANLRRMFTSDEWVRSKAAKDPKGKKAIDIVLMPSFWNDVICTLKAMGPIVRVLRLVDNEKRPAMGYIYEAMDRAKEAIQKAFNGNEDKYKDIFVIIVDHIHNQLPMYKRAAGMFGYPAVVRKRTTMAPAEWWKMYRVHTPHLQNFAIKVLSLTCSSSGCERNWSTFEHIHSKKRSRLEHQKLQDLVYVKYNQALQERYECRDLIDPIVLNDIDHSNEWIVGEMGEDAEDELVFDDDVLTWRDVASATGAAEPLKYTRKQTKMQRAAAASTSGKEKGKGVVEEVVEEEDEDESSEDEGEIEYHSSASGSDEEDDMELEEDD